MRVLAAGSGQFRKQLRAALWLMLFGAGAAMAQTGAVAGHVLCADTQTPCRFASVSIQGAPPLKNGTVAASAAAGSSQTYSASTDLDGSFQISGVLPGDYYILARLAGYVSPYDLANSEYPDDSALRSGALETALTRIVVDANQTAVANLALTRGATLAGTVRFDDGGVANSLAVRLFRRDAAGKWVAYSNTAGSSRTSALGISTRTTDLGRFYEPGLPPGTYTISVQLPEVRLISTGITGRGVLNVRPSAGDALEVYNGNAYRLRDAAPIALRDGETHDGIEFTVPTRGLHLLRGTVSAVSDTSRQMRGGVRLLDPDDKSALRSTTIQPDGEFEFRYVLPGQYLIAIDAQPGRGSSSGLGYEPLTAPLAVDGDLTTLSYTVTPSKR